MSTITSATSSTYIASAPAVTQSGAFAEQAATLSTDSSVIASLSSTSSSSTTPLYTAQGLMNSLLQAATDASTSSDTSTSSTSTDTGTDSTDSGTTSTTFDGTSNWATVLKSNPNLTSTYLTDESNQLIVNSLSVHA